jgi:pilus assembly protein CpaE
MDKRPRAFVVENDPDVRFQIQRTVQEAGFTDAGGAGLGTEAVAQAMEAAPDVILCGFKEPLQRCIQTAEALGHRLDGIPIVAYSTSDDLQTVRKAMLAGARDFLSAPFRADELRRSLTGILESEERRHLRAAENGTLGPQGAVITIFGAKGGVGKTTVAANLAVALVRRAGQSVTLVDADDTFGDAAAMLALSPERSVTEALGKLDDSNGASDDGLKELLTLHESGLAVLPTPMNPLEWRDASPERLHDLIRRLAKQFDTVLVDTGANLSEVSQAALEAASLVLWITTPEYASVRDSVQALESIERVGLADETIRVVLNLTSPDIEVSPASVEQALGRQIFWTIPYDKRLRRSAQLGQALLDADPKSAAAQNLSDLALLLSGMPRAARRRGWLGRALTGREARVAASRAAT